MPRSDVELARFVSQTVQDVGGRVLFIGSMAVNVFARPRPSNDVDLLLLMSVDELKRWIPLLQQGKLAFDPRDLFEIQEQGGHASIHDPETMTRLDVKFALTPEEQAQFIRGYPLENGMAVSGLEDTIAYKLHFNRKHDREDVEDILKMSGRQVDDPRLRELLKRLGVPFSRYQRLSKRMKQ